MSQQEESQSTPALIHIPEFAGENCTSSLSIIPKTNLLESCTRLSVSLEEDGLFKGLSRSSSSSVTTSHNMTLEELRAVNKYAESTKSLSYLPQVHERQTARMRTRSEWFLSPLIAPEQLLYAIDSDPTSIFLLRSSCSRSSADYRLLKMLTKKGGTGLSASAESIHKRPSIRRNNSRHVHRASSKRNKENGSSKKHSPSASFKKSHHDKSESKPLKFSVHDGQSGNKQETEPLKEGSVNANVGRLLKDGGCTETLQDPFGNLSHVQNLRLLKMTSLDSAHAKQVGAQAKFQKMNSLGSSSFLGEAKPSPQTCKQMNVDEVKEEEGSDMDVTPYNVTMSYKPRI
ncbi:hypothetical protein RUM44_006867 [Polyplax serrata]|uniref:Uncharacterized protein n=1 Tax=Polyplax serrata TaxID=468196 RepID=A0ABR1AL16_POLSC